jgi:hypothetical protein
MVAKIATGEIEEKLPERSAAAELGSRGGKARAKALTAQQRAEIGRKGAASRAEPLIRPLIGEERTFTC